MPASRMAAQNVQQSPPPCAAGYVKNSLVSELCQMPLKIHSNIVT